MNDLPPPSHKVFYAQAIYGQEEIDAVIDVLKNRPLQLMSGPSVAEFETRVAELFGKSMGLMVNSGSSANLLAISALNLPAGSEVITPALTFSTTVAPLLQNGLLPTFVDIEEDTYNIDADAMLEVLRIGREKLSDKGTKSANKRVDPVRSQTGMSREDVIAAF